MYQSSCNITVIFFDFNETCILSTDFLQILEYQMSEKVIHWDRSCPYGRTEKTNVIVTFRNFANVTKIQKNTLLNMVTQELFEIYLFLVYVISI
jgi:hypothetical protein